MALIGQNNAAQNKKAKESLEREEKIKAEIRISRKLL